MPMHVDPILMLQHRTSTVTMRCLLVTLLVGVFSLSAAADVRAQGPTVRIDPATVTVGLNATTTVNVRIENVSNLAGAEIHLTYNPAIVQVMAIQAGGFPPPDFVAQSSYANGKIDYAIAVMPPQHQAVSGSGVLLQITLKGLTLGQSPLNFTSVILAATGATQINAATQNGSVVVSQNPPPTTQASPTATATATVQPSVTSQPGSTHLSIVPSPMSLQVNTSGTVAVQLDNPTNLWGIDVKLSYDQTIVACSNQPVKGTVPQPNVVATNSCSNGTAEYIVSQQAPTNPANSSGNVMQLTFQCLQAGTTQLNFQVAKLVDRNGQTLPVTVANGQITCQAVAPSLTPTVIPTPTTPPLPPSQILGYHYVRYGETLFCIGRAYGVSPWSIASENGIYYPNFLTVGQKLAIPNVPWQSPPGPVCQRQFNPGGTPPPVPPPPVGCRATYLVHYGDTLYSIAWRYRTTVQAIAAANNLYSPNWIWAGQWLCIP